MVSTGFAHLMAPITHADALERVRIDCSVEGDRVRVGGNVAVVFEAQIEL
jgi:hypothetical protein